MVDAAALLDAAERPSRPQDQQFEREAAALAQIEAAGSFVVTCAQNNTPINERFFQALRNYADAHAARLLVIPIRYKNPTSRTDPQEDDVDRPDYWWPAELHPYLIENVVRAGPYLVLGDLRVAATAANPLSGLEVLAGKGNLIVGHPHLQMQCVATPAGQPARVLHTTGSVSAQNYSRTAAGYKARFHHTTGAVCVRNGHLRQLVWSEKNGNFADLHELWSPRTVETLPGIEAIITGDEHAWWMEPDAREATYGPGGIVQTLRPRVIVRHDVIDCYSICHYHEKSLVERYVKHLTNRHELEAELSHLVAHLRMTTPPWASNVIVASNHDDRIGRWLQGPPEPWNARIHAELRAAVLQGATLGAAGASAPNPLALWLTDKVQRTRFLRRGESYAVQGIELGYHGDLGVHGARGTPSTFAKVAPRTVTGHCHHPGIRHGAWVVGMSGPLDPAYSRGSASAAMHTHCLIHRNGKRQLVTITGGKWR